MNRQNATLKKAMIAALESTMGIVTQAAKKAGIDRNTHYLWMRDDADYAASVRALDDATIDFAESALYRQIRDGNTPATIFFLKTKGKKRGYDERATLELSADTVKTLMQVRFVEAEKK